MSFIRSISSAAVAALIGVSSPTWADGHAPTADQVIATVDGTDITLGHMIVMKQRLPQQYQQLPPNVLFDGILDQLIQQTLLGTQVDALSLGSQLTLENEERAIRASEQISVISQDAITDEALQAAYDEAFGGFEAETEYNANHILVETEEEAQSLVADLDGGADFAELAKEKSTGPSGPGGGSLGWFGKGSMVPPFEEAVVAAEVGSIVGPIQTQFGWHVIKLNETRLKEAPKLDEVRAQLVEDVQRKAIEGQIETLTEGAEISRLGATDVDPALLDDLSLIEN